MHLDKHPVLLKIHNLVQALEELGCGEEYTKEVSFAGEIGADVEKILDARPWTKCECLKQNELRGVFVPTYKGCPNCKGLGFYQE